MIDLYKLTPKEKELLRKMVLYTCEECSRTEEELGCKLHIHRLKRGNRGGIYHLRNVKVICKYKGLKDRKESCHSRYHQNEFSRSKST